MTVISRPPELSVALAAAREAGQAIRRYYRNAYEVEDKSPDNPITDADREADRILRERITAAFPGDGWLSEETRDNPARLSKERVWIVDPLDGTKDFIGGIPEFALSIALWAAGEIVLGVTHNPATGELFYALRGEGAWQVGGGADGQRRLQVTSRGRLEGCRVLASRSEYGRGEFEGFIVPLEIVPTGSIAYKLALVAAGRADATWSQGPKSEWDIAAGVLLVTEAGGQVTDLDGAPHRFNQLQPAVNGIVATNGHLHAAVMALLETHPVEREGWR